MYHCEETSWNVSAEGRITKTVKDHSENMKTMDSISSRITARLKLNDSLLSFKKQQIQLHHMLGQEECYTQSELFNLRTKHNQTIRMRDKDKRARAAKAAASTLVNMGDLHPLYKDLA